MRKTAAFCDILRFFSGATADPLPQICVKFSEDHTPEKFFAEFFMGLPSDDPYFGTQSKILERR